MIKFFRNILIFVLCVAIIQCSLCILVDPFNVFHPFSVRDNGVEPAKNYIKMKYIISSNNFDAFLFGSSRVGNIHTENISNVSCYNMTYSCGTPVEHLRNIKTLISNGIVPKHIYIGLDHSSYMEDYEKHDSSELQSSYEYSLSSPFRFWIKYFSPSSVGSALTDVMIPYLFDNHPLGSSYQDIFYKYGWNYDYNFNSGNIIYNSSDKISANKTFITNFSWDATSATTRYGNMQQTLDAIEEIVNICEDYDITLTIFTNPTYYELFVEGLSQQYITFLKELSAITPFYNFSGFNNITTDEKNYLDISHYNAEIGDLIIKSICYNQTDAVLLSQGFGVYTTEENIDYLVNILLNP